MKKRVETRPVRGTVSAQATEGELRGAIKWNSYIFASIKPQDSKQEAKQQVVETETQSKSNS